MRSNEKSREELRAEVFRIRTEVCRRLGLGRAELEHYEQMLQMVDESLGNEGPLVTEKPDVVAQLRADLLAALDQYGPDVVEPVLRALEAVSYRGDDVAYVTEARIVMREAAQKAMQPLLDAASAEVTRLKAANEALDKIEAFRRTPTSKTKH